MIKPPPVPIIVYDYNDVTAYFVEAGYITEDELDLVWSTLCDVSDIHNGELVKMNMFLDIALDTADEEDVEYARQILVMQKFVDAVEHAYPESRGMMIGFHIIY